MYVYVYVCVCLFVCMYAPYVNDSLGDFAFKALIVFLMHHDNLMIVDLLVNC
jgi:hypothetical protein